MVKEIVVSNMSRSCPNCGEAIKKEDVFCPFCGTPASKAPSGKVYPAQVASSGEITCPNCNANNVPSNKFCSFCGSDLVKVSTEYSAAYSPPDTAEQETYSYGSYHTTSADGERKWYQPPQRKRSARHPLEWFFYIGWSLYIILRILFYVFICFAQVAGRRR
ncbi:MAG: zinc ribbon domain-containing protein [Asgard group archaeon]|nr:zinc ribbon domain-containing protein [Asgard group archaeon]